MTTEATEGWKPGVDAVSVPAHGEAVGDPELKSAAERAVELHLADPSTPAVQLAEMSGLSLTDIRLLYKAMQADADLITRSLSPYYPQRLMTQFARATVADWMADPAYADRLLEGRPVAPRNLEVHATRGTCDYGCAMCLWSDKEDLTYKQLDLANAGLVQPTEWKSLFGDAKELGTQRIVFSGGGEPLLNNRLFELSAAARAMGLTTHLYSNGRLLNRANEADWAEIVHMEQVRFSMHAPLPDIYNAIVNMPERAKALDVVSDNIRQLLARRQVEGGNVRVGIGFVTQKLNYSHIEAMVDFAQALGVDFINLRQDEVEVTEELGSEQRAQIAHQLRSIRSRLIRGDFGAMYVDMADSMTALANGQDYAIRPVADCSAKVFRPAISPYGAVAPCDLRAEPRFHDPDYVIGDVKRTGLPIIMASVAKQRVAADCEQCMPSGKTINAMVAKLRADYEAGIHYGEQPFANA